jgi:prevent-host-death family protein
MSRIVGAFEAKTKLSELLDLVEQGEEVLITRRGKTIARLSSPLTEEEQVARAREAVRRLKELGKENRLPEGMTIKDLITEGRKY